jgi:hypothetical protein
MNIRPLILITMLWLTNTAFAKTDTSNIYASTEKSVYQIRVINKQTSKKSSIGSGFTVNKTNILATNYHVVSGYVNAPDKYDLEYLAKDGRKGKLEILDLDTTHDLAVLRAKNGLGPPLKIAPLPEKGAHLYSLGNPMDLGFSIVKGVNNGVMRNSEEKNILVSGSLNPGMSGGPTLNEEGNVIGINVATSGNEISFLVPAEHLTHILERLERRNYKPVYNIYDTISQQLVKNSQDKIQGLLDNDWAGTTISGFSVPSELSKTYKCWDGSPSFKKDVLYHLTSINCSNQYNIFLSDSLDVGGIAYEYHWLSSDRMSPSHFYHSIYQSFNESVPPSSADREDVTNFACQTSFVTLTEKTFKATICRRDYLKYTGLSDVLITMAMVGEKRQGFIFNMDLVGTDFNSSMDLLRKVMERIKWQS